MQISPVTRSKHAAKEAYNRLSRIYDLLAGSSETPVMQKGLEKLAVTNGESFLEIGCGTGKALLEISKIAGDSGRVHGIDLSPGMLRQAKMRLAGIELQNRLTLLEGDGTHLPYSNCCFDVVFLSFTLELFDTPEIPVVLAECWRVLTTNGRLGVVSLLKTGHPNWVVRLYEWFHTHLPNYADCRPIVVDVMVEAAGFRIDDLQVRNMWGLPVAVTLAHKT